MRLIPFLILSTLLVLPGQTFAEEEEKTQPEEPKKALYFALKPSLVANITGGGRYVRADIQIMTSDEAQLENIKLHAPALRHELLLLLSEQKGKALKTPEGKEAFRKKALEAVQAVIEEQTGTASIDNLFFTSFFVQ